MSCTDEERTNERTNERTTEPVDQVLLRQWRQARSNGQPTYGLIQLPNH